MSRLRGKEEPVTFYDREAWDRMNNFPTWDHVFFDTFGGRLRHWWYRHRPRRRGRH